MLRRRLTLTVTAISLPVSVRCPAPHPHESRLCAGFNRLRMLSSGNGPVAFVEFATTRDAAAARASLQGALLLSSETALQLEYARHKSPHTWILAYEVCTIPHGFI
ncbi:unnamed protein product [Danaus chrysippus]|uniref:(African queen) hypothetical protein n=1 Tax=Danaus chrysippus TaxID=151541 RepID=A0A8J2VSK4_9NEOP|nr:unnamed protein product [Danaus chrysippus]